jgi:hypothetical protein
MADSQNNKPIDRWLTYGAIAMGIVLYLAPKSPFVIISCLFLIFILLVHPAWNFWWLERALWRKLLALSVLVACLAGLAVVSWPPQPTVMYFIPGPVANDNATRAYGMQFHGDQPLYKVSVFVTDVDALDVATKTGNKPDLFEHYSRMPFIPDEEEVDARHTDLIHWYPYRPFRLNQETLNFDIQSRYIDVREHLQVYQNVPHTFPAYYLSITNTRTGKLLQECISDSRYSSYDKSKSRLSLCCGDAYPKEGIYASCAAWPTRAIRWLARFASCAASRHAVLSRDNAHES